MNHTATISENFSHPMNGAINTVLEERLSEEMFINLRKGEIGRFRALLAMGGNPNAVNREGFSLLMVAARDNAIDAVDALLNVPGLDINMKGPGGIASIVLAMAGGNFDIVKTLMREYADVSDITDVEEARKHGRHDLAAQLEMAKLSLIYAKNAEDKKKQIEKEKLQHESEFSFAKFRASVAISISEVYGNVAVKTKAAKDYVWEAAATAKKKTVEKARYAKECTSEFCSAFAKAAVSKSQATREYATDVYSRFFGEGTPQAAIAAEFTVNAIEMMEKSKFPPAEITAHVIEQQLAKAAAAPAPRPPRAF